MLGKPCLFYAIATVFQLYHGGDLNAWHEKEKNLSLHYYQLKGSLTSHTISEWYERNWSLMTLSVIHGGRMDCSTAKCYGSGGICTPVPRVTYSALLTNWVISPPHALLSVTCLEISSLASLQVAPPPVESYTPVTQSPLRAMPLALSEMLSCMSSNTPSRWRPLLVYVHLHKQVAL